MQNLDRRQGGISTQIFLPPQFKNYDRTLMATPFMSRKFAIYVPMLFEFWNQPYYARDGKSAPPVKDEWEIEDKYGTKRSILYAEEATRLRRIHGNRRRLFKTSKLDKLLHTPI